MVLSVSGKVFETEQRGKWWSYNLVIEGGFIKVIAESTTPLPYKIGDHITAVAKHSRLEKGTLKMFSTPGLMSLVDE